MLIIAGHARVPEADRDRYVAAHGDLIERARKADGCRDAVISGDPLDPGRVNVYERWDSQVALDAWRLSLTHRTQASSSTRTTCSSSP
jgi:quinol monooxygenase YgiN